MGIVLRAMPGNVTLLADERPAYSASDTVVVDVWTYIRPVDVVIQRSFAFNGSEANAPTRITNAKMLAMDGLDCFAHGRTEKLTVVAGVPESNVQQSTQAPEPAAPAPAPAKPKRAAKKEPEPPEQPAQPPAAPPQAQPAPADDEPGVGSDEPASADEDGPEWPHSGKPEDVLIVYGAANGQRVGSQTIEKLRWLSGTVPGRIKDREQRALTPEEALMVQAAAYIVDRKEFEAKRAGR